MEDMKNVNFLVMLSQPLGKVRREGGWGGGDGIFPPVLQSRPELTIVAVAADLVKRNRLQQKVAVLY